MIQRDSGYAICYVDYTTNNRNHQEFITIHYNFAMINHYSAQTIQDLQGMYYKSLWTITEVQRTITNLEQTIMYPHKCTKGVLRIKFIPKLNGVYWFLQKECQEYQWKASDAAANHYGPLCIFP